MSKKPNSESRPTTVRVLLSWMGLNNDFHRKRTPDNKPDKSPAGVVGFDDTGPHGQLYMPDGMLAHQREIRQPFDYHFICSDADNAEITRRFLIDGLRSRVNELGHELIQVEVGDRIVSDEENDALKAVMEFHSKAVAIVKERHGDERKIELHVFVSPGLPVMQVCWGMLVWSGHLSATLWRQTRLKEAAGYDHLWQLTRRVEFTRFRQRVAEAMASPMQPPENLLPGDWERLKRYAKLREPILLVGPPGVGKTELAKLIHALSGRSGEFIRWTITGKGADIIETELVGAKAGAYTGGSGKDTYGLLDACNGGTLFIDEVESGNPDAQTKLLSILDQATGQTSYRPVKDDRERTVDVRFVFATNQDLDTFKHPSGQPLRTDYVKRVRRGIEIRLRPLDFASMSESALMRTLHDAFDRAVKDSGDLLLARPAWSREALQFIRQELNPVSFRDLADYMRKVWVWLSEEKAQVINVDHLKRAAEDVSPSGWSMFKSKAHAAAEPALPVDSVTSIVSSEQVGAWQSVINGLLSCASAEEVLQRIHSGCSAIRPDYVEPFVKELNRPEARAAMKHLRGLGLPLSSKRLRERLKKSGLR